MVATVPTVAYLGLEARGVEVLCSLISGLPNFTVVGLGDKAVNESRERVRGAIASLGLSLPRPSGLPSTYRQPTCPRKDRITICQSHLRCWGRWGS